MARYVIEPQRNSLPPHADETWFVNCDDEVAEIFAVIDTVEEIIVEDFQTREEAERCISSLKGVGQ